MDLSALANIYDVLVVNSSMLDSKDKLDFIKIEIGLIQNTFDKYDGLIYQTRNWYVSLWTALISVGFTIGSQKLSMVAALLAILYWFFEGNVRYQYMSRYSARYRTIREALNDGSYEGLKVYDLTDTLKNDKRFDSSRIMESYFRWEYLFYLAMAVVGLLMTYLNGQQPSQSGVPPV